MDAANRPEEKLMTFAAKQYQTEIVSLKKPAVLPPSTKKTEAARELRRTELEHKLYNEQVKAKEEMERDYKNRRLTQRVKCSPALIDNQAALLAMREQSMAQKREEMLINEKLWERKRAEIEYNVANRPLLVELQSQQFRANLTEMREVENFVQILREAKLNPEEHLNDRQKELLQNAEYLDRLNASTAYFPTVNTGLLHREPTYEGEEEEEEDYMGEGEMEEGEYENEENEMQDDNVEPVNEVNEGEEHDEDYENDSNAFEDGEGEEGELIEVDSAEIE